jgi:hypothetical protein
MSKATACSIKQIENIFWISSNRVMIAQLLAHAFLQVVFLALQYQVLALIKDFTH